ncbi:hypothetical protein MJ560_04000 [Klebsiella pneumoniae]|nr:hypothetical protein MJ560_04000 [Klebsiella pneumoniae]
MLNASRSSNRCGTPSAANSGGRHELYEINYSGSQDEIRLQCLRQAQSSGNMDKMMAMVDRCLVRVMTRTGWTVPHLHTTADINISWISC